MSGKALRVWLDELHVADVERGRGGEVRCRYTPAALERWPLNTPVLSCSLPLAARARAAEPFFRGLLPEGSALDALAARADMRASDTFGLLARYGRDIAGALVVADDEASQRRPRVEPYTDATFAEEVAELEVRPLGVHDDSELSIAGLQNKLLLVALPGGGWGRPVHGHPSTHILKADSATRPGLVEAELQCLGLARELGLTTVETELVQVGAQACLIVSRFDRRAREGSPAERVHQEDLCQATGTLAKYQSRDRGGPGFADAARLLDAHAPDSVAELSRLLAAATFTLAIGNADAHGKNLALLHEPVGTSRLAPLYDTVPTIMWPSLRTDAAMAVNGRFSLLHCDRVDLIEEAVTWPLPRRVAEDVVDATLEQLRDAIPRTLEPGSPLARTIAARTQSLLAGAVPGPPVATFE